MIHYRVLRLVLPEYEAGYPEIYKTNSADFPHLLEYIEDVSIILILDTESGQVYPANEFFAMAGHGWITEFEAVELPEGDERVKWPERKIGRVREQSEQEVKIRAALAQLPGVDRVTDWTPWRMSQSDEKQIFFTVWGKEGEISYYTSIPASQEMLEDLGDEAVKYILERFEEERNRLLSQRP